MPTSSSVVEPDLVEDRLGQLVQLREIESTSWGISV